MNWYDGIAYSLVAVIIVLLVIAYLLKRILNILRQINDGEPSKDDLTKIELKNMRLKG